MSMPALHRANGKAKGRSARAPRTRAASVVSAVKPGALSREQLLEIYRAMMRIRVLDDRMITLQRQGRVGFYGACTGQEAATIASGYALKATDWVFQALREQGVALMRGLPLVPLIAQVFGNSGDITKGRQMPSHPASRAVNHVSWSSVIGTQLPHAVGAAWAAKLKGHDTVAMAFLGDGATSSNDFHVAMNFAGVFKVPVVFVCQNNHWSISVPTSHQTASESIAVKAVAYGLPGVKVDGNDVEAVYAAVSEAVTRARAGQGATLVECETYRMGAHSTSDDPTRYRDQNEVEEWKKRDPIQRAFRRLVTLGAWDSQRDEALKASLLEEVNAAIKEAESLPPPNLDSLFDDVYEHETWNLAEQRAELKAGLR
jgi:pyruvate dehydrogenase E1 component alpha subunit/2-oxoisovalerate dehydrogenase E1 component alpha subunit